MKLTALQSTEDRILYLMSSSEDYARRALTDLDVDDFTTDIARSVFTACVEIDKAGGKLDDVSINSKLDINDLVGFTESIANGMDVRGTLDSCIEALRSFRRRRDVVAACELAITEAKENTEGYFERLQQAISSAADRTMKVVERIGTAATEALMSIGKKEAMLNTGFSDLDKALGGGLRSTDLMIVGARPSVGKTAFAMNIAVNVALKDKVVAVYSMEMEQKALLKRAAFSIARTSEHDILRCNDQATMRALNAAERLGDSRMYIDDRGGLTADQIRTSAITIKNREKQLDLIVIDYLQLMSCHGRKNGTREQEVAEMSRAMKRLAMELKCPVILLSQLSRGIENRDDKTPRLADLRESGSIEQDADSVVFLHRPAVWDRNADPHEAAVYVAKNRNGALANIDLQWFGEWFLYVGIDNEEDDGYEEVPFEL